MTKQIKHRQPGDQVVERLRSIMIDGATLVATGEGDDQLYRTPAGRFFVIVGGDLRPVTEAEAIAFKGGIMTEDKSTDVSPDDFPPVMTVDQVAAYLQVSTRTVYNMVAAGRLPGAKVGEQWRFYRPEVDRWLMVLSRANVGDSTPVEGAVHGDV